ncbi:integral membrane protein [Streptomyces sp. PAMC 26508]|nr:integral membrane protein [Streptomyces sp. PAMC 26508]
MTYMDDVTESKVLLAEYDRLKEEQKTRIGFRDNLLYFTLAAVTAVVAVTVQSGQAGLLLSAPAICLILGWTYLVNDEKISAIGCYVRDRLGPRLGDLASARGAMFGWEVYHRDVAGRAVRKRLQTAVDLFTYLILPMVCTVAFWCSPTVHPLLVLTSLAQTLTLAALGWQFLRRAEG